MPSQKATAALRKAHQKTELKEAGITAGLQAARTDLRAAMLAAVDLRFDLADVNDTADRQQGIEEMNQKIGAYEREARKLIDQMDLVLSIAREIERETPRIAGQLGVDLT